MYLLLLGSKIFERLVGKTPNSGTIGLGGLVSALIAGYQMFWFLSNFS